MEMEGTRALAVTQQQAWAALNDPEVLKVCIPGCDKVEATGENQYAVGVAVKIGPAQFETRTQELSIESESTNLEDTQRESITSIKPRNCIFFY